MEAKLRRRAIGAGLVAGLLIGPAGFAWWALHKPAPAAQGLILALPLDHLQARSGVITTYAGFFRKPTFPYVEYHRFAAGEPDTGFEPDPLAKKGLPAGPVLRQDPR